MFQENSIETCILSRVKQITSPGWMHETSSRTWCSGKTWRERVEREVGGGIGMGKTCKLKAVSFQCMTKFTTNFKKRKKRKKKTLSLSQDPISNIVSTLSPKKKKKKKTRPNPRLGSWDFTLLQTPPSHPATTPSCCLQALVLDL